MADSFPSGPGGCSSQKGKTDKAPHEKGVWCVQRHFAAVSLAVFGIVNETVFPGPISRPTERIEDQQSHKRAFALQRVGIVAVDLRTPCHSQRIIRRIDGFFERYNFAVNTASRFINFNLSTFFLIQPKTGNRCRFHAEGRHCRNTEEDGNE